MVNLLAFVRLVATVSQADFDECFQANSGAFDADDPCRFYVANARCLESRGHPPEAYEANIKDCGAGLTSVVFAAENGAYELKASISLLKGDNMAKYAQSLCQDRPCAVGAYHGLGRRFAQAANLNKKSVAAHLQKYGFVEHFFVQFRESFVGIPSTCHLQDLSEAIYELCSSALPEKSRCTAPEFSGLLAASQVWHTQECSFERMGVWTGTDKTFLHNYHRLYEPLLKRYRSVLLPASVHNATQLQMLEIGMKEGASLNLWLSYFKAAKIWSIDIAAAPECQPCPMGGAFVFGGSQSDVPFLESVIAKTCGSSAGSSSGSAGSSSGGAGSDDACLDFIIDDGGHTPFQQLTSLRTLFPTALKAGGVYVIEDIETSYWTKGAVDDCEVDGAKHCTGEEVSMGLDHPSNFMTPIKVQCM
jgi:hypothetical protein